VLLSRLNLDSISFLNITDRKKAYLRKLTIFLYEEVKDLYGSKGNVSVPPPTILKMMLLLILSNSRSERELMNNLPMRLDRL
jgi:hypothetical protein